MKIGIIGSGIAGLSAAWLFNRSGHGVTLFEKHHTLADYLQHKNYSKTFIYDFLYPILASTVCTCSYDCLDAYPATVILQTLLNLFGSQPLLRTKYGTQDVVKRLSRGIDDIRYGTTVCAVNLTPDGVRVETTKGQADIFDHLIVATQANQAQNFLSTPSEAECNMLDSFSYEDVPVFVHQDPALMPVKYKDWAHINLIIAFVDSIAGNLFAH